MIKSTKVIMGCTLMFLVTLTLAVTYGTNVNPPQAHRYPGEIKNLAPEQIPKELFEKKTYSKNTLQLRAGEFTPEPLNEPREGRFHYILQFTSTIQPAWLNELENAGIFFDSYINPYAFFVSADKEGFQAAINAPFVKYIAEYPSSKKIDPLTKRTAFSHSISEKGEDSQKIESDMFSILLFKDGDLEQVAAWLKEKNAKILFKNPKSSQILTFIRDHSLLEQIADLDDVLFIEQFFEPQLFLDTSQGIVKSVMPVDVTGVDGTGVTVAVVDTGWDYTHPDFPSGVRALDYTESDTSDGVAEDMDGHGTHTATTVLGRGTGGWGPFGRIPRGIAPGANLIVQRIFDDSGSLGAGVTVLQLMIDALSQGAHISSNSWGWSPGGGAYTQQCVEADQTVGSGLSQFWAAGNAGAAGIDFPGSAKNVVTVGASENYEQDGWYGGSFSAIDPDRRVSFSSVGYAADGRVKPDIMAPGSWVLAGRTTLRDPYNFWGASVSEPSRYSCYYAYMGGTSMATPTAAGAGADIMDAWGVSSCPPSFLKALLINTAEPTDNNGDTLPDGFYYYDPNTGLPVQPQIDYGWGRINTMNAIYNSPNHSLMWVVRENLPITQGSGYYINDFLIPAGMVLKVTLVWTDPPGNPAVIPQLVNDLDLFVVDDVSTWTLWWNGNMFDPANPNFSFQNPAAYDSTNNVEQVIIQGTGATVDICWGAFSIPSGQPFSQYSVVLSLDYEDPFAPAVVDFNGGIGQTEDNHFGVLNAAANQTITVDVYESRGYFGGGMPNTLTLHYSIDGGADQTIPLNGPGGAGIVTYSTNVLDLSSAATRVDFWVEGQDVAANTLWNGGQELNGGTGGYKYTLYVQDVVGPDCRGIDPWPDEVVTASPTAVTAYIYENVNMGATVTLNYSVNGGPPQSAVLTGPGGSGYMAYSGTVDLSGSCSGNVSMWVSGTDTAGNPITACPAQHLVLRETQPPVITGFEPTARCVVPNASNLWVEATISENCSMPSTVTLHWMANPDCAPTILLVDDDRGTSTGNHVETYYQNALTAAGFAYTDWDTESLGSPTSVDMAPYDVVIWFTGSDWSSTLSAADETNLATYIGGGGTLFFSSQDYLYDVGLTLFGQTYLRINNYTNDVGTTTISGIAGDPISQSLGTLPLSYPFSDYSDEVLPTGTGSSVFLNDGGIPCGVRANNAATVFFGFPFEAIGAAADRATVMERIVNHLVGNAGTQVVLTGPGGTGGVYTVTPPDVDLSGTSVGDTVVFWITGTDDAGNAIAGGSPCSPLGSVTIGSGAGLPYTVLMTANPAQIPPDGSSTSLITATVLDSNGVPVPDGTVVTFSTTLGSITPSSTTTGGVATAVLTASTTPGTAVITAWAGQSGVVCVWRVYGVASVAIGREQEGPVPTKAPDHGKQICSLSRFNIEKAQTLVSEVEQLLKEAKEQGLDTTDAETLFAEALQLIEDSKNFTRQNQNCIAGNNAAIKAQNLLISAKELLESLLA